jgi:hypothetical protein
MAFQAIDAFGINVFNDSNPEFVGSDELECSMRSPDIDDERACARNPLPPGPGERSCEHANSFVPSCAATVPIATRPSHF